MKRLEQIYRSRLTFWVLLVAALPVWGATRLTAWDDLVRSRGFMGSSEIFLGAAAAPLGLTPWYYDEKSRLAFLAKKRPLAAWRTEDDGNPRYVHVPPWEPGITLPLIVAHRLLGLPLSLRTLAGIQLGLDAAVVLSIGLLARAIGGPVAAALAMWVYARGLDPAFAAALPFYYYWPIPFSLAVVATLAALIRMAGPKSRWPGFLSLGLLVGAWCWFRGTALPMLFVAPLLVAVAFGFGRAALRASALVMLGGLVALSPAIIHNVHYWGSPMPRGQLWHDLYVGLGTRPNPYGIRHDDLDAIAEARKEGVAFQGPGYESLLRGRYLRIAVVNPGLIARNFALNLGDALSGWCFLGSSSLLHWSWLAALLGMLALWKRHDPRAPLLSIACALWFVQCATLAIVGRPQLSYLWETLGLSTLCGAAGLGALLESAALAIRERVGSRFAAPGRDVGPEPSLSETPSASEP